MALVKGVNSYVTVAEADDYFADRVNVPAWTVATEAEKAKALITATSTLDKETWTGVAISDTQYLAFPRSGSYFDPKFGSILELNEINPPERILQATYELAHHLLINADILDDTGVVRSLGVGQIKLDFIKAPSLIPSNVKSLIKPLLENKGANSWWRAN